MVDAATVIGFVANGIVFGSILALAAVGLSLVYGILRLSNFAHGDFVTLGAFAALFLARVLLSETVDGLALTGIAALGTVSLATTSDPAQAVAALGNGHMLTAFGAAIYGSALRWVVMLAPLAFVSSTSGFTGLRVKNVSNCGTMRSQRRPSVPKNEKLKRQSRVDS